MSLDRDDPTRKQGIADHLGKGGAIIVLPADLEVAIQSFAELTAEVPLGTSVTMIKTLDGQTMVVADKTSSGINGDNV